jgi:hypothetical protein
VWKREWQHWNGRSFAVEKYFHIRPLWIFLMP